MSAKDFPVDFGYGATDGYYYGKNGIFGPYHKGNDYLTPTGTPIDIGGVTIGKTGASGGVSGPHLHVQAGTDFYAQQDIDPTPHAFQPGVVVHTGQASQWGNYIIIKTSSAYVVYAHLSSINVNIGTEIGNTYMITKDNKYDLRVINSEVKGWDRTKTHKGEYDARELSAWVGKPFNTFIQQAWREGASYRALKDKWANSFVALPKVQQQVKDLTAQLKQHEAADAEQAKIIANLQKLLEDAQGANKADLEAAQSKIQELTLQLQAIQEDKQAVDVPSAWKIVIDHLKTVVDKISKTIGLRR